MNSWLRFCQSLSKTTTNTISLWQRPLFPDLKPGGLLHWKGCGKLILMELYFRNPRQLWWVLWVEIFREERWQLCLKSLVYLNLQLRWKLWLQELACIWLDNWSSKRVNLKREPTNISSAILSTDVCLTPYGHMIAELNANSLSFVTCSFLMYFVGQILLLMFGQCVWFSLHLVVSYATWCSLYYSGWLSLLIKLSYSFQI